MIKVIDDFLPLNDFRIIHDTMMSTRFPWNYSDGIVDDEEEYGQFQFIHMFYTPNQGKTGGHCEILNSLIDKIEPELLIRIKANLSPKTNKSVTTKFHTDYGYSGGKTAIYYVNTNNGYTLFEDGTRVESVSNRIVIFDNHHLHAGVSCTDENIRVVINLNYFPSRGQQIINSKCEEQEDLNLKSMPLFESEDKTEKEFLMSQFEEFLKDIPGIIQT